jgi:predicted nucleic acid-binding protein
MRCLVDTNIVVTHLRRKKKKGSSYISGLGLKQFGVSTITLSELYRGCFKSNRVSLNVESVKRLTLLSEVSVYLVDEKVALEYGKLMAELESSGVSLDLADVYIAATARLYELVLYTQDKKHFTRFNNFGIKIQIVES